MSEPESHPPKYSGKTSNFVIWDVSDFSNVKPGQIFISSPLSIADASDKKILRNDFNVMAVVDTNPPHSLGYTLPERNGGEYRRRSFLKNDLLGQTLCQINLRNTTYWSNVNAGMSFVDAVRGAVESIWANSPNKPNQALWDQVYKRTSAEDFLAILESSSSVISRVFNEVFAEEACYPLLMTGGYRLFLNGLLLMLLLLLIGTPVDDIDCWRSQMVERFKVPPEGTVEDGTLGHYIDSMVAQRSGLAVSIQTHIREKHCSIDAYLLRAGVSLETQQKIKSIVLAGKGKLDAPE